MKNNLYITAFSLFLCLFSLFRGSESAADDSISTQKLRLIFSANVQAELGPCG